LSYCRKCGAKLEENARFCHVCGTPVAPAPALPTAKPAAHRRRSVNMVLVGVLIAVLLVVVAVSALIFLPITPINYVQTKSVASEAGVSQLNLNLQADTADINIIPQRVNDNTLVLNVSATGSTGIFGSTTPVKVTFGNRTVSSSTTVSASVSRVGASFSVNLHVVCDVYVDPKAELNLMVHTNVGQVNMSAEDQTIQALALQTTTGNVEAALGKNVAVTGNVSITTTTGTATLNWNQADAERNISVYVKSTTGAANVQVKRDYFLSGNVTVEASTTTGSVNFDMTIHDDVSAQIEASKVFGAINVQQEGFSENQELLQSNNYPAPSNFNVKLSTTTGTVNIDATYQSLATRS
jgi:DUF4097 and DUF4098 domain-containing protein YvlB